MLRLALGMVLAGAAACSEPAPVKAAPEARPALLPGENVDSHARTVEVAQHAKEHPEASLVFLGDSITQGWAARGLEAWQREFAGYAPLNLGVSGDRTEHVLWRLDSGAYDHLHPKLFVIMIGTNNTGHRKDPPADIAAGVKEILAQLKRRFPKTRLVLLAIFPRGETPEDPERRNNAAANALLEGVARESGAEWLDLNRAFTDEKGVLSKELFTDKLHLSERGYEVWANALRDPLKRWMQ